MSSYTEDEFIAELKASNAVIAEFTDAEVGVFVTMALRAFSGIFPELQVEPDNEVVSGQELYDIPEGALRVTKIMDSDSRKEIGFAIENQGEGDQIRLGNIIRGSMSDLLEQPYYSSPLAVYTSGQVTGYSSFDIEYAILQTLETIKDTSLDAIAAYVEYLACNNKAGGVSVAAVGNSERVAESITDSDSSGASTTIKYSSSKDTSTMLKQQATEALERFRGFTYMAYGTRG